MTAQTIRHGDTVSGETAMDTLDALRAGLVHDKVCESDAPRDPHACPGCESDHHIARIVGALWDGYDVAAVKLVAEHAIAGLPYGLGCTVRDIVWAIRADLI